MENVFAVSLKDQLSLFFICDPKQQTNKIRLPFRMKVCLWFGDENCFPRGSQSNWDQDKRKLVRSSAFASKQRFRGGSCTPMHSHYDPMRRDQMKPYPNSSNTLEPSGNPILDVTVVRQNAGKGEGAISQSNEFKSLRDGIGEGISPFLEASQCGYKVHRIQQRRYRITDPHGEIIEPVLFGRS